MLSNSLEQSVTSHLSKHSRITWYTMKATYCDKAPQLNEASSCFWWLLGEGHAREMSLTFFHTSQEQRSSRCFSAPMFFFFSKTGNTKVRIFLEISSKILQEIPKFLQEFHCRFLMWFCSGISYWIAPILPHVLLSWRGPC